MKWPLELPKGQMLLLDGGQVMVGTGGQEWLLLPDFELVSPTEAPLLYSLASPAIFDSQASWPFLVDVLVSGSLGASEEEREEVMRRTMLGLTVLLESLGRQSATGVLSNVTSGVEYTVTVMPSYAESGPESEAEEMGPAGSKGKSQILH